MVELTGLPQEMLLEIVNKLWLPELHHFASTSRYLLSLAKKRLSQHYHMRTYFGDWNVQRAAARQEVFDHDTLRLEPVNDLLNVTWNDIFWMSYWITEADAFEHVGRLPLVTMTVHPDFAGWSPVAFWPPKMTDSLHRRMDRVVHQYSESEAQATLQKKLQEHLWLAMQSQCPQLSAYPVQPTVYRARESLSLLLFLLCPNVHTLDVVSTWSDWVWMFGTMGRLLLDLTCHLNPSRWNNLTTVLYKDKLYADLNAIVPFLCIPSVKVVQVGRCVHINENTIIWPHTTDVSNVTSIMMDDSMLSAKAIITLAAHLTNLCTIEMKWQSADPAEYFYDIDAIWGEHFELEQFSWHKCVISPQTHLAETEKENNDGSSTAEVRSEMLKVEFFDSNGKVEVPVEA